MIFIKIRYNLSVHQLTTVFSKILMLYICRVVFFKYINLLEIIIQNTVNSKISTQIDDLQMSILFF